MNDFIIFCEKIYKELGKGLTENIYQEALSVILRKNNINYSKEQVLPIFFEGENIGFVRADIVIKEMNIVIECKAISTFNKSNFPQIIIYMELLGYKSGLFVNFNQNVSMNLQIHIVTKIDDEYIFDDVYNLSRVILDNKGNEIIKENKKENKKEKKI